MPKNDEKPPKIVGDRLDGTETEVLHNRTIGKHQEEYVERWSSGYARIVVRNDTEALREASKRKAKKVKLKYEPGSERYERNQHEPIKI